MRHLTKAEAHTGAMVALYPSLATAHTLAQPGGEPVEDLHVTLAFLGDAARIHDRGKLFQAVAGAAATISPITGVVSGTGTFTAGEQPVTYASIDCPALPRVREFVCAMLAGAGFEPSREHGFTPHITLAYDGREVQVPNVPLLFDAITVVIAGERWSVPLSGVSKPSVPEPRTTFDLVINTLHPSDPAVVQAVAAAAVAKRDEVERIVPIWKGADAQRIVYGVVLQPGVVDSQGDVVSAQEIEQAAHRYLVESRKQDLQHMEEEAPVEVVESYIAPIDMEVAGRRVLKGSWVMASHIADDTIWQHVLKGDLTGYSIGGTAVRV